LDEEGSGELGGDGGGDFEVATGRAFAATADGRGAPDSALVTSGRRECTFAPKFFGGG
jgi:hypothetical protein